jgi:hypothetical protein
MPNLRGFLLKGKERNPPRPSGSQEFSQRRLSAKRPQRRRWIISEEVYYYFQKLTTRFMQKIGIKKTPLQIIAS